MTEHDKEILDESNKIIKQLYDLATFFEEPAILRIYLQTQVIHKLFEENESFDINKLELFHLQFTTTLIELLEKIRTRNERLVGMYETEIELNEKIVAEFRLELTQEGSFDREKKLQAQRVARTILNFHKALSANSSSYPFTENISSFSIDFYKEHFFVVEPAMQEGLMKYRREDVYRNRFGLIGKELLNKLSINLYRITFFAGIRVGNIMMEIYRIGDNDDYFVFVPAKNYFLPCDISIFPYQEWIVELSKKEQTIKELIQKNIELEKAIKENRNYIDADIIDLLGENLKKISEANFLSELEEIDVQANTLKAMLRTKMI
jgi:hypothetical protein